MAGPDTVGAEAQPMSGTETATTIAPDITTRRGMADSDVIPKLQA